MYAELRALSGFLEGWTMCAEESRPDGKLKHNRQNLSEAFIAADVLSSDGWAVVTASLCAMTFVPFPYADPPFLRENLEICFLLFFL